MECFSGARNTQGFTSQIQIGHLPSETHLTYEGVFNELRFDVGKKTDKIVDLHLGYARYQFAQSQHDHEINDYLAMFVKGAADGQDRDARKLNAIICLDISGSMGGGLGGWNQGPTKSRLELSVQAIKMFISKLRPDDAIGMVTFNNQAQLIFQPTFKRDISPKLFDDLDNIKTNGGTTIRSGFQASRKLLEEWSFIHDYPKGCENRIIMLTDVCDNSIQNEKDFIEKACEDGGASLTIIGISDDFQSSVCESLKEVRGFNYFCAVSEKDIKKYVFETFDFGFFPSAFDVGITLQSQDLIKFEAYGTPDSQRVAEYNKNFLEPAHNFLVTKVKSIFPSEIQIVGDRVFTLGGLILLKLKRRTNQPFFKGSVKLEYRDIYGQLKQQVYELDFSFPPNEQFFSDDSLREAIEGFTFASEMKSLLKQANQTSKNREVYTKFWPTLINLEPIVPKSKLKELNDIKKIFQKYKQLK